MRKLFYSFYAFLFLLSFSTWADETERAPLQARGDYNFPPYDFLDATGEPSGFDIDVLRAVAKAVDLDIEIQMGPWSQVRDDLENGRIDIVTGMIASAEREDRVDFSTPILTINYAVFTRDDSSIDSIEDLHDLELIVQRDDIMHDYAVANQLTSRLILVESQVEALRLLATGKHDAALTSKIQGHYLIHKYMLSNVKVAANFFHPQDLCFAVAEDDDVLQAKLNEGLRIIKADNTYADIYERWFGVYDDRSFAEELTYYAIWVLTPLLVLLLTALVWTWTLRRQVAKKTRQLQQELAERQRIESQLESERLFRDLVEAAPIPMGIVEHEQKLVYLNDKFNELFGYTLDQLPNIEAWFNLAYPDASYRQKARDEFHNRVLPLVKEGKESIALEREVTCKDGKKRSVIVHFAPVDNRGFLLFNDITALKRVETALRQSEARIRGIFNNLAAGIEVLDRQGIIVEVNDRLAAILGYTPQELIGKSPLEFTHPDDLETSREFLKKALQGRVDTYRREKRYVRKDGSSFWGDLTFTQVVSPSGEIIEDVGIIFDITERKAIEQELREVNRELETFVYSVSHDLRTPLSSILGYTELLTDFEQYDLDEKVMECLRHIEQSGRRMSELIEDLLQLASVGHLKRPKESVNVEELVKEVMIDLGSQLIVAGVTVHLQPLPPVRLPRTLLRQVFENLIGNALRYGGKQGETIDVGGQQIADHLRYFVRDRGPGIPVNERDKVFSLFYRGSTSRQTTGTGVGLAIVQKIARLYGGEAWAEDTPGGGTTIFFEIEDSLPPSE